MKVDQTLNFFYSQVNKDLKDIYVPSNCACIIVIMYQIFNIKVILNIILINQFQNYLLPNFIILNFFKFCQS